MLMYWQVYNDNTIFEFVGCNIWQWAVIKVEFSQRWKLADNPIPSVFHWILPGISSHLIHINIRGNYQEKSDKFTISWPNKLPVRHKMRIHSLAINTRSIKVQNISTVNWCRNSQCQFCISSGSTPGLC